VTISFTRKTLIHGVSSCLLLQTKKCFHVLLIPITSFEQHFASNGTKFCAGYILCVCFLLPHTFRDLIRNVRLRSAIFPLNENKCPGSLHITTNHNLRPLASRVCIFLFRPTLITVVIAITVSFSSVLHHPAQETNGNLSMNLLDACRKGNNTKTDERE
jgi:hypothetical protein